MKFQAKSDKYSNFGTLGGGDEVGGAAAAAAAEAAEARLSGFGSGGSSGGNMLPAALLNLDLSTAQVLDTPVEL